MTEMCLKGVEGLVEAELYQGSRGLQTARHEVNWGCSMSQMRCNKLGWETHPR